MKVSVLKRAAMLLTRYTFTVHRKHQKILPEKREKFKIVKKYDY